MAEQFNARLDPDYADRAKAYMEAHDLRKGQAAKRLMQQGIDAVEDRPDPDAMLERVSMALAVAGFVSFAAGFGLWGWFDWGPLPGLAPVWALFVMTALYLGAGWGVSRYSRGRST